jgi:RNA polymerase sigma-70 factor (ECF subfamily)
VTGPPPTAASSEDFAAVFDRVGAKLHRLALALTADPASAEDVVQEAFVRVWRRRDRLTAPGQLDRYLLRAVRNLAFDLHRRGKVRSAALEEGKLGLLAPGAGSASDGVDREALNAALAALPPEQREVVVLRAFEGLTAPEIAERTGAPVGTVHSRYRYALERLRSTLKEAP